MISAPDRSPDDPARRTAPWIAFPLLLLGIAAIGFLRNPDAFLWPVAHYDDGHMFAYYYAHRGFPALLRPYGGYISLVPNMIGYVACALPVTWVPRILAVVPLALSSLAFAWLALPAYRFLIPRDRWRYALCLALPLFPFGDHFMIGNTTYSQWNLLMILIWTAILPPPRSFPRALVRSVLLFLLIFSHPLAVLLIPVHLFQLIRFRRSGKAIAFYLMLVALTLLANRILVHAPPSRMPSPLDGIAHTGELIRDRVVHSVLFGIGSEGGGSPYAFASYTLAFLVLGGTALPFLRRRTDAGAERRIVLCVLLYLIVALTAGFVFGRQSMARGLPIALGHRYFWVQRYLLVVVCGVLGFRWIAGRFRGRLRSGLLVLLFLGWLGVLNVRGNGGYETSREEGERLREFTREVARMEREGNGTVSARHEREKASFTLRR